MTLVRNDTGVSRDNTWICKILNIPSQNIKWNDLLQFSHTYNVKQSEETTKKCARIAIYLVQNYAAK